MDKSVKPNVLANVAKTIVTTSASPNKYSGLTLSSPEMQTAIVKACKLQDEVEKSWLEVAKMLKGAGVETYHIERDDAKFDEATTKKITAMCAQYLKKAELEVYSADKTSLTSEQIKEKRKYELRVNEKMQLIRKYLKQLTDAELGVNKIIPLGDKLGDKAQEIIDSIQKAKSEKITFRMVEALELARMLKNALKNMPNLEYQEFKKKGING